MTATQVIAPGWTASPSPLPVFEHRLAGYRRIWRGSVFSTFLLPVLFLLGMGISVGAFVNRAGELGVPYLDYIAPGLVGAESGFPFIHARHAGMAPQANHAGLRRNPLGAS